MNTQNQRIIEVIAHRGMGEGFVQPDQPPENTLPSFEAAWAAGADACELDVHLTSDDQVIVIHDDTTGRTANTDLSVADYTLAELQKLDAGGWKGAKWSGTRFPKLSEVLETIPVGRRLYVEIKSGPSIVPYLADVIRNSTKAADQLVVISFDYESLAASRRELPDLKHFFLVVFQWDTNALQWNVAYDLTQRDSQLFRTQWQKPADIDRLIQMTKDAGFDGIDVSQEQPDEFFQKMKEAGLDWVVWTVDDPNAALAMAVKGAASITTNRFQYVTGLLQSHGFQTGTCGGDG